MKLNLIFTLTAFITLLVVPSPFSHAATITVTGVETTIEALADGNAAFAVDDTVTLATGSPEIDITSGTPWTFTKDDLNYTTLSDGKVYAEFVILMNETGGGNSITMNDFNLSVGGVSLWDLDTGEDNEVVFNEGTIDFNSGGASAEIAIYICHEVFSVLGDTDTISTTMDFTGGTNGADFIGFGAGDGSTPPPPNPIPEPTSILYLALGAGLVFGRRRKRRTL